MRGSDNSNNGLLEIVGFDLKDRTAVRAGFLFFFFPLSECFKI